MGGERSRVYFDHNATSPLRPVAREVMERVLASGAANPSSLHMEGRRARAFLEAAREQVAALVHAAPDEVVFTSGGSEAIAAGVRGVCERGGSDRRRIVVGATEHSAVLESVGRMAAQGFGTEVTPCDRGGFIDPEAFLSRLGADVVLAALQLANPETGVIEPAFEIAEGCAAAGIPLLVDAVQAAGKIPIDFANGAADLLVLSGHKLGAPQGTGALIVRRGRVLVPLIGGGAQERRRRGGTEAVAALAGFGAAACAAKGALREETARLEGLRRRIESRLLAAFPGARVHGASAPRLPNTVHFALPGVPGEILVIALDVEGFALSTGSACASGAVEPSHVLRAMGLTEAEAREGVRLSMGWSTTAAEVDLWLTRLPSIAARVREGLSGGVDP